MTAQPLVSSISVKNCSICVWNRVMGVYWSTLPAPSFMSSQLLACVCIVGLIKSLSSCPCASCLIQSICRPSFTVLQLAVATIATSVLVTPTKVSTEGDTLNFTHKETALVPVSLLPVLSAISLSPVCCHEIWNPTQCRRRGCFREAHCDVTVRDALSWTRMRMECISEIFSDVRKFKVLGGRRCDRDADSAISFSIRHHYILFCNAVSRGQVPDFQIIMLL